MRCFVHGGAGSPPRTPDAAQAALADAADAGASEDRPGAAVVAAIRELESDPQFNAGRGSAVQGDGVIRTDAGLMTGDRAVGAACAMAGVEHAIEVARRVQTETPHVLLAGERAVEFAAGQGIETGCDLWIDRTRERWAALDPPDEPAARLAWVREQFGSTDRGDHDTVGAVATDGDRVAAGTSTGGRWCALAGRVGDVPQVGCGFFADTAGAASATGTGEDIARTTLARRAVQRLADGHDPAEAATSAVEELTEQTDGTAGLIVTSADGSVGSAFSSAAMPTADSE